MLKKLHSLFFSYELSGYWATTFGILNLATFLIMTEYAGASALGLIIHFSCGILFWIFFWVWINHFIRSLN